MVCHGSVTKACSHWSKTLAYEQEKGFENSTQLVEEVKPKSILRQGRIQETGGSRISHLCCRPFLQFASASLCPLPPWSFNTTPAIYEHIVMSVFFPKSVCLTFRRPSSWHKKILTHNKIPRTYMQTKSQIFNTTHPSLTFLILMKYCSPLNSGAPSPSLPSDLISLTFLN